MPKNQNIVAKMALNAKCLTKSILYNILWVLVLGCGLVNLFILKFNIIKL